MHHNGSHARIGAFLFGSVVIDLQVFSYNIMANSESSLELGGDTANVAPVERRNYPGILDNFNPKFAPNADS